MKLINPETLLKRIKKAKKEVPNLVKEALKESKLEEVNKDNLLKGMDSEGNDMPFYSPNSEYGFEKTMRNPKNRGRWDLKNTGEYHKGIYTSINKKEVLFKQRVRNKKTNWISMIMERANREPIGITKEQLVNAQKENIPKIQERLFEIINNGK